MIANYHTHTYRCGHAAKCDERPYIERAISQGLKTLGFAEHAPMPFPDGIPQSNLDRLLAMRMKLHETEDYINTLMALREEYKNDIDIHIGFEVEYFSACFDAFIEYISQYPVEYLILGQHFSAIEKEPMAHFGSPIRSDELLKEYVDLAICGMETGKISYIAHPDMIFYTGNIEAYEREMTRLINCANEHNMPLEINFYGLQQIRNYPNFTFWQIAAEIGCDVIFGVDAHNPENIVNPLAEKYAKRMIAANPKLNLLDTVTFKSVK